MGYALRLVQLLIGLAFWMAGLTKLFFTQTMISREVPPWITSHDALVVKALGVVELSGGLMMTLGALKIMPPIDELCRREASRVETESGREASRPSYRTKPQGGPM